MLKTDKKYKYDQCFMDNVKQVHKRQTKKVGCINHQSTGNNSALLLGKCSAVMSLCGTAISAPFTGLPCPT